MIIQVKQDRPKVRQSLSQYKYSIQIFHRNRTITENRVLSNEKEKMMDKNDKRSEGRIFQLLAMDVFLQQYLGSWKEMRNFRIDAKQLEEAGVTVLIVSSAQTVSERMIYTKMMIQVMSQLYKRTISNFGNKEIRKK